MHFLMAWLMLTSSTLSDGRDLIGLAAAVLAAVMAANASWLLTDKFMTRRSARASED